MGRAGSTFGVIQLSQLLLTAARDRPMRAARAGLRSAEEQLWLGRLAQCPNVHLIASADHVNAALLWDTRSCMRFRCACFVCVGGCGWVGVGVCPVAVFLGCFFLIWVEFCF